MLTKLLTKLLTSLGVAGILDTPWKLGFVQHSWVFIHISFSWYQDFLNLGDTSICFFTDITNTFTWSKLYKGLILSIRIHCWPKCYSTYAHAKSPYFGAKNMKSTSSFLNKVDSSVVPLSLGSSRKCRRENLEAI